MSPFVGDVVTASSVTMVEDKVDETQTESSAQPGFATGRAQGERTSLPHRVVGSLGGNRMIRGLYTAVSGMVAQERRYETLTLNAANAQTPGYKVERPVQRAFPEMLLARTREIGSAAIPQRLAMGQAVIGPLTTGVYVQERIGDFRQGDLVETGSPLDLALYDDRLYLTLAEGGAPQKATLFFAVARPDGAVRYVRAGRFAVDGEGYLATPSGSRVLDASGAPIRLYNPADPAQTAAYAAGELRVDADGRVRLVDGRGQMILGAGGQPLVDRLLGLVAALDPHGMVREGDGHYRWEGDAANLVPLDPATAAGANLREALRAQGGVRQGFYEASNLDPAQTMVDLMEALRAYEANQRVVQAYDQTLEKLFGEVGKV